MRANVGVGALATGTVSGTTSDAEYEAILLDEEAEMSSMVGVVNEDNAILAHVARVVHEDEVVYAVGARSREWDGSQPLLGGDEAVYPEARQPDWADIFNTVDRYTLVAVPLPSCLSPVPSVKPAHVLIDQPPHNEKIRDAGDGEAELVNTANTVPKQGDPPSVEIELEANVEGCYDELRWAYDSMIPGCEDHNVRKGNGGTGETTTTELYSCGCSGRRYRIRSMRWTPTTTSSRRTSTNSTPTSGAERRHGCGPFSRARPRWRADRTVGGSRKARPQRQLVKRRVR